MLDTLDCLNAQNRTPIGFPCSIEEVWVFLVIAQPHQPTFSSYFSSFLKGKKETRRKPITKSIGESLYKRQLQLTSPTQPQSSNGTVHHFRHRKCQKAGGICCNHGKWCQHRLPLPRQFSSHPLLLLISSHGNSRRSSSCSAA